MAGKPAGLWKDFWAYVGFGVAACILLAIPLIAIDWLLENLPLVGKVVTFVQELDAPLLGIVLGLVAALLALGLLGWVLRRHLWDALSRLPVIGTLMTSGQQLATALKGIDRSRRDLVAWVNFRFYRELGVVMSRTRDEDGTEFCTIYLLAGAGQFQGNSIVSVETHKLVFPGWSVDDAVVFSSSGGAVVPEHSLASGTMASPADRPRAGSLDE